MEGAEASIIISGMAFDGQMSHLRVSQPMNGESVGNSPTADPGADGKVHNLLGSFTRAISPFAKRRAVDIRIKFHWQMERFTQRSQQITVAPSWLGCCRDIAKR